MLVSKRFWLLYILLSGHSSALNFDRGGVVGRSDIVLTQPNLLANQAMPLGNGRLGVALWSANGLTAQLNRVDTMPGRLSPGQLVIPGLSKLTSASNYAGRLNLYDGEFVEHGSGLTVTAYVESGSDTLVIDVTGADPAIPQTAMLKLWPPRTPRAFVSGKIGMLAQSWLDDHNPGASGRAFGTLASLTAQGRNVSVAVSAALTITVKVTPEHDGHFRILVAAPHYDGTQNAPMLVTRALQPVSSAAHQQAWHSFWTRAGLIKATSPDGAADYYENLRHLYLYSAKASSGGEYPGSQAGLANLFSSVEDTHRWDPSAFWHWNLRMQVAANLGAGLPELNAPYFRLYRQNLASIESWTREHMAGRSGICVPETMRFNGPGFEYETGRGKAAVTALNCDASSQPYYNARTISTGAEVSLWIWQQYLITNDHKFLAENYTVIAAAARFLLDYQHDGQDGLDHTSPSNAHEQQWDTVDPTTDIAARMFLFPMAIKAGKLLKRDPELIEKLTAALPRIPAIPRTQQSGSHSLLANGVGVGSDVIADSYVPTAQDHNFENIGLELVWPYNLIGDTSPLFPLARRTYLSRRYPTNQDWSFDPIQAARLGLSSEVSATLLTLTVKYQTFVNGFANWGGTLGEFYLEQAGVVATALEEALVQDYDGLIRVAPAIPLGWDVDGVVAVQGATKVAVQARDGKPINVEIYPGVSQEIRIRNPWPGKPVKIASSSKPIKYTEVGSTLLFLAKAGTSYQVSQQEVGVLSSVTAQRNNAVRKLKTVQIGL